MATPKRWPYGWLLVVLTLGFVGPSALATDLDQQLDIRPFNATAGQPRNVADQWLRLGSQQATAGRPAEAIASWQQAIEIYHALGDTVALGLTYDYIGLTFASLGQYDQAESALRRRLAIARDNQNLQREIFGWNNLGSLLLQQGNVAAAQAAFSEASVLARSVNHPEGLGLSLSNLGLVAAIQGQWQDARKYYETAAGYRYTAADWAGEAHTSNGLGDVYQALDQESAAIGAYRLALRLARDVNDVAVQLRAIDGLLPIYLDRNELTTVRRLIDQRLALTLGANDPQTVVSLMYAGDYYRRSGDIAAARTLYYRGMQLAAALEMKLEQADLANRLVQLGGLPVL
ncbi:hypothetical protein XM38_047040 [Halomicronema hongdechloris C2206]|uniref:Uncharacterized protein n=1 Tax=Halomicronema hongdechloris C2206 TaxID=1641165 RepID=A0A1Z3HTZ3_9CYAN|nr:tetratricopeptide repeat protein [Halomicronema hongdechloris]ASC73732.1 hypothetical protein XM38_047040 [Halomicronema hongdechloris C2206]